MLTGRYMLGLAAFAASLTTFELNTAGVLVFALITGVTFALCEDLLAPLPPFLFTAILSFKCYDSFSTFIRFKTFGALLICLIAAHFVLFWEKPVLRGYLTPPMLFVSLSVLLGGAGSLPAGEYFTGTSLFYIFGLGIGMWALYILFNTHIRARGEYALSEKLTLIMVVAGCLVCYMILAHYLRHIGELAETKSILYFQWRNNSSTMLMLAIPFAFLRGNRKSPFIILGFFFYFCILLTGSRGGLVFGAIEVVMCCILFILYDKRRRLAYLTICACLGFALMIFSREFFSFFGDTLNRLLSAINGILVDERKEIRVLHCERGILDFLNHPLFGTGLGYNGNRDVYNSVHFTINWYHCEPIQIAASLGAVGIAAYSYQFVKRMLLLWKEPTLFNITVFLSYISLELMSLVNPGIFCPLPYLMLVTLFFVVVEKCGAGEHQTKINGEPPAVGNGKRLRQIAETINSE